MRTWRTLHPRRILYEPGAISVHGGISTGEPRTQILWFGAECSADKAAAGITQIYQLFVFFFHWNLIRKNGIRMWSNLSLKLGNKPLISICTVCNNCNIDGMRLCYKFWMWKIRPKHVLRDKNVEKKIWYLMDYKYFHLVLI